MLDFITQQQHNLLRAPLLTLQLLHHHLGCLLCDLRGGLYWLVFRWSVSACIYLHVMHVLAQVPLCSVRAVWFWFAFFSSLLHSGSLRSPTTDIPEPLPGVLSLACAPLECIKGVPSG